ncbi:DinB family protein [Kineosporia succinea]|uniref:Damage-inducible protein DinB n=1 Tax=Kineosporia succinea TaxID=84632 RepID=A0ABT9P5B6_9ACTN|nr:DinB family protein [Kineosporia succinea]MDP9827888.1 putative damage-inducible protein DinB [Kineosporia succinea]
MKDLLVDSLRGQREHVLGILEGLPDEALLRPVLPSGWNCLALVSHLTHDVERFWFQGVVAGRVEAQETDGWNQELGDSARIIGYYRTSIAEADRIIEATALDRPPVWWPPYFPTGHRDLGQTLLHVITETACHAGHLDAARELLDGRRWLVL